jgi:hypothetical protein
MKEPRNGSNNQRRGPFILLSGREARGLHPEAVSPSLDSQAPLQDQTHLSLLEGEPTTQLAQNEPTAPAIAADDSAIRVNSTTPYEQNEANAASYLPEDEPTVFLSVLPRHPDQPSSIPAHWPATLHQ